MEELGITKAQLSRRLGVSDVAVTLMLAEEGQSSRLVPLVHEALGLSPPPRPESVEIDQSERDAIKREIDQAWASLSEEERQHVVALVRLLRKQ